MSLLDNLISYWALNEASGNALDAHGSNALTGTGSPGSAAGILDNARTFSGAAQYFARADNAELSTGDVDFTLSCWVYLSAKVANRQVVGKWLSTTNNREYRIVYASGSDRFLFQISGNGVSTTTVTDAVFGSPPLNTWMHIVAFHDSTANQAGIQINGGTPTTAAHTTGAFNGASAFTIGVIGEGNGDYWNGRIDEVGLWKRVLTVEERTDLYNSGNGLAYESFTSSYKYPTLRNAIAGYYARLDTGAAATDQFTADGSQDGTLTNGATRSGSPLAYFLDGLNDYIDCGDSNSFTFSGAMSVAFWCNLTALPPASNGQRMWIATKGNTGQFEFELAINAFSTAFGKFVLTRYNLGATASVSRASTTSATTGTWTHVCFTASSYADTPNCYLNGVLNNGTVLNFGTPSSGNGTAPMQIGRRATATENTFNGSLDDVIFFNRVLTTDEIGYLASQRGAAYELVSTAVSPRRRRDAMNMIGGGL